MRDGADSRVSVPQTASLGWNLLQFTKLVESPKRRDQSTHLPMQSVRKDPLFLVVSSCLDPNFIHDPRATYDFCYNTELLKFHGALSTDSPKPPIIRPMFQQSKFLRNGEIVLTPLDYYYNSTEHGTGQDQYMSWDDKDVPKLFWRGKTTGDAYSARNDFNWKNSHRIRLHTITHDTEGYRQIYVKSRRTGGWEMQTWESGKVNKAYTDVGLTDGPMQVCATDCAITR